MTNKTTHSIQAKEAISPEGQKGVFFAKKKSNIPEPVEDVKQIGKKDYFQWGADNLYPQWLNELYQNSAIHSGIIKAKVHFTVSGGLNYVPLDENDTQDIVNWERMLSNSFSDYSLDDITEQASQDFEISNMFMFKGRWNLDFTFVEKLELLDFEKGRKMAGGDLIYSNDWSDRTPSIKVYQRLNLKLKGSKAREGVKRTREFFIQYETKSKQSKIPGTKKLTKGIYPIPPYSGGIKPICTGIEIDEYQNAEIVNGFSLGTIINLNNGEPKNGDDKKKLERGIAGASTGASQSGGIFMLYNNGKDNAATVVNLNGNDLPDRYKNLNTDTQKGILRSHSVTTPILFGFVEEGSLGDNTALQTGYAIMKANYFKSRQDALLSVLNFVGKKCNGLKGDIEFNEVELDLPDNTIEPAVTVNVSQAPEKTKQGEEVEETLLKHLGLTGVARDKQMILSRIEVKDPENLSEEACLKAFIKDSFALLSNDQEQVLSLIGEGNGFTAIKDALEIKASALAKMYSRLIALNLINSEGVLSKTGATQIAQSEADKIEILYSYEKRSDAPALVAGGKSRLFCKTLVGLNRFYTRDEIDTISSFEGYDVFSFKGGWYTNPDTDKHTPFCRHTWVQNVVFK